MKILAVFMFHLSSGDNLVADGYAAKNIYLFNAKPFVGKMLIDNVKIFQTVYVIQHHLLLLNRVSNPVRRS